MPYLDKEELEPGLMFRDLWDHRAMEAQERRTALKLETTAVEKKISQFLDRIVDADSQTVIAVPC